ncbi:MAG: efflux RND transporter permease subunit [Deltaproteobacteria bacterium]|nr:efflux RND transporter permease subunit [Deltaproteobacteria bacterium]
MKITDLFIRRPVLALVVNLVVIIAGLQAIRTLNVRQYPRSENASVTVATVYVGASADLVRSFVTAPLERAIAAADGIEYMESQSALGLSTIKVRLRLNYDSTKALAEIGSKVDQVRRDLPPEAEVPVINIESADSRFASAYLSFSSDLLQQNEITDYLVRVVQPRLSSIPGVQRADILGARTFAMRIWLKPDRMAALDISPAQVRRALAANNFLSALGRSKGAYIQVNLTADTNLNTVDEFRRLVVRQRNGTLVRLGDIADVVLGTEDYDAEVRFSGQTAVFMGIWPLPNANSLDVIKRVRSEMEAIRRDLPTGLSARVAYDATNYISNAIREVLKTLGDTLLIVVVVIFLFLGSVRSVLVPVVAIPVSLVGGVFLMQIFGFTVNLLTLLAIVLSVGLVVDDAIVVVENVERHLREGRTPLDAALGGARELVGPIIAMTITLAAVYLPIGLQGGLTGSLFREFAFTLAGAVAISGIVALTLSPVMSSRLLKPDGGERGLAGRISRGFERLKFAYVRRLDATLKARPAVYAVWIVVSLLTVPMFVMSAKELAPTEDQGVIFGILDASANSTLEQNSHFAKEVNRVFQGVPETDFTFQITFPSSGFSGMVARPWADRKRTVFDILPEVQQGLHKVPGVQIFPVTPPALPGGGDFPVEFVLASTAEAGQILDFAHQLQMKAIESRMFAFPPTIDVKVDQPQSEFIIDRDKGESRQLRTEGSRFLPAFTLAVVLIFLVLAAQFNSFRDPFVILAGSVPLAMFGALIFTFLKMPDPNVSFWTRGWTTTFNIYSQVGLVTLVGLVSKNGILIVEFANKLQLQGLSKAHAVRRAAMTRLRPILMVSAATIAGHFPLTLVTGAGAAARNSIGLVLVGGMFIGTLFTLFVVPSIYMLIARDHGKDRERAEAIAGEAA